ncbi:MAG: ABC transporter permease [Haloechinothrix sp.]
MTTSAAPPAVDEKAESIGRPEGYGADHSMVRDVGLIWRFTVQIARHMPGVRKYFTEVFRQAGIFIFTSSPIIWFMMALIAAEISLQGHYLLKQLGAGGYAGLFAAVSDYTVAAIMWGWILAAKVGCGLVAEIGSMRISEEIDALDVMGVDSKSYLVSTRVLAIVIVTPFMFTIGFALMYYVNVLLNVSVYETASMGAFYTVFWSFMTNMDVILSASAGLIIGVVIVLVGCYYGYNASGGPVGVGKNTAKSMIINLIVVSVIGIIYQQLFFGGFPRTPIGN